MNTVFIHSFYLNNVGIRIWNIYATDLSLTIFIIRKQEFHRFLIPDVSFIKVELKNL